MKLIRYSIFQPQVAQGAPDSWYSSHNNGLPLDQYTTDGADEKWTALIATDGTGGYIDGNLVLSAEKIVNDVVTNTYTIGATYNFASLVASVIQGAVADPVSGQILP